MSAGLIEAGLIGVAVSALLTPFAGLIARRLDALDQPNERSSHAIPTPRTGGYAIVIAIAVGALAAWAFADSQVRTVGAASLPLIALAAIDEVRPLPRVVRFIAQLLVGGIVAFALVQTGPADPTIYASILVGAAVLGTVWTTNAYNFMDGINGLASSAAVVTGTAMAILFSRRGDFPAAALAIAIAGSAAGFLPWNMTGSIFMGDVGSSTLGFLFACLVLRAGWDGLLIPAAILLTPIVSDATLTLIIRAIRGERFFSTPHRSHCYQLLVQRGWSHASVSALWTGLAVASALVALAWSGMTAPMRGVAVLALLSMHGVVFVLSRRQPSRLVSSHDPG